MRHLKSFSNWNNINENKMFSKNVVDTLTKKFNSSSEDTINKIQIFGLFRNTKPFNQVKDITQIDKNKLEDLFSIWYHNTLNDLVKVKPFVSNRELAEKYLLAYVNNIKSLPNAQPFTLRNIEKTLVDICNNNGWVKQKGGSSERDIYNPHDEDILYQDDEIVVLSGATKPKCIQYGFGESWCIGRTDLNFYSTYRIKYGATIYFILDKTKNKNHSEHKLVLLNYGNEGVAIADRTNSPSGRHGGPEQAKDINFWFKDFPFLEGKENLFKYEPVTKEEEDIDHLASMYIKDDDIEYVIEQKIKGLTLRGTPLDKYEFMRLYLANGNELTKEQETSLSEEMVSTVVEIGYTFKTTETMSINQVRRYLKVGTDDADIYQNKIKGLTSEQFKILIPDGTIKVETLPWVILIKLVNQNIVEFSYLEKIKPSDTGILFKNNKAIILFTDWTDENLLKFFHDRSQYGAEQVLNDNAYDWNYNVDFDLSDAVDNLTSENIQKIKRLIIQENISINTEEGEDIITSETIEDYDLKELLEEHASFIVDNYMEPAYINAFDDSYHSKLWETYTDALINLLGEMVWVEGDDRAYIKQFYKHLINPETGENEKRESEYSNNLGFKMSLDTLISHIERGLEIDEDYNLEEYNIHDLLPKIFYEDDLLIDINRQVNNIYIGIDDAKDYFNDRLADELPEPKPIKAAEGQLNLFGESKIVEKYSDFIKKKKS